MKPPLLVVLVALTVSCAATPPPSPEHPAPSPEALARKARSDARLTSEGVPVNKFLPVIETAVEAKIRSRAAVVDRAIALMLVAVKAEGLNSAEVAKAIERFGAETLFTPEEKAFIAQPDPDKQARAQFSWRYECLAVLLWALGHTQSLGSPGQMVDAGPLVGMLMKPGPAKFREQGQLRSAGELLDEADLIYRYDWACVDARVNKTPEPRGVNCEVVVERHQALNWLIGYQGQDWDDVSTDT